MIYIIFERKFNEHCLQDIVERYTVKLFYYKLSICIQVFLEILLNILAIRPVIFLTRAVFLYDYFWVCSFLKIFSLYDIHELSNLTRICLLTIIYILFNLLIYSICCYTCTKKCCFVTCLHLYKEKLNFVLI